MVAVTARKNKVTAGVCQCARKLLAESATGTRNDSNTATEIKKIVAHCTSPGFRMTFIKFGSREWRRSNHLGPSSKGLTAVISDFTWTAPRANMSMHSGYSPDE